MPNWLSHGFDWDLKKKSIKIFIQINRTHKMWTIHHYLFNVHRVFRFLSACWPIPISSDGKVNRSASSHIQIHRRLTTFYCIFAFKMKNVSIWFNPPKCSTRREHRQLKQYQSIWTIKYEIRSHSVFNCNIGNVVSFFWTELEKEMKRGSERESWKWQIICRRMVNEDRFVSGPKSC